MSIEKAIGSFDHTYGHFGHRISFDPIAVFSIQWAFPQLHNMFNRFIPLEVDFDDFGTYFYEIRADFEINTRELSE